ncbi:MAG: hypothetical protein R3A10_03530 [Caldilineaceae bacterium]
MGVIACRARLPEPFYIHYWDFGNETYGGVPDAPFVSGFRVEVWTCDGGEYIDGADGHCGLPEFRAAMRAVDPTIAGAWSAITPPTTMAAGRATC